MLRHGDAPEAVSGSGRRGPEVEHNHARRLAEGFYDRYLSGTDILDIGYRGGHADAVPVTESAIGVELDYPGYDGLHLPFPDSSQDAVFASHTLEHIAEWRIVLADWFRVLRTGGHLVIAVPHQYLYERKADLPSRFNGGHMRFYTPASLMAEIEAALPVGCWRLRSLRDIDDGFSYSTPPEARPTGCYEIELVVQKIARPAYADRLKPLPGAREAIVQAAELVTEALRLRREGGDFSALQARLVTLPLPSIRQLDRFLPQGVERAALEEVMRPWLQSAPFDEADYLARYGDVRKAVDDGRIGAGKDHYVRHGYFAGRIAKPVPEIFA
jgi:SAM-dependent methyltransferase